MNEYQKPNAPYAVAVLVLGILSIVIGCGLIGLILGIIGLVLGNKGYAAYFQNPEQWGGFGMLKAGRICSIIGICLGGLGMILSIVSVIAWGGMIGSGLFAGGLLGNM